MNLGKFVTVEGVEGAGKSTNMDVIQSYLSEQGVDFILTREPGGSEYGEKIRELLLGHFDEELDATAELLLIFAARAQHLARRIKPALSAGTWVLCDRFTDASYAYQGAGRALGFDIVAKLEAMVLKELRPDLTLILDLPVEIGMQRVDARGERDRFEIEQQDFFQRIRSAYLTLAAASPDRYRVIDTSQSREQVADDIRIEISKIMGVQA